MLFNTTKIKDAMKFTELNYHLIIPQQNLRCITNVIHFSLAINDICIMSFSLNAPLSQQSFKALRTKKRKFKNFDVTAFVLL